MDAYGNILWRLIATQNLHESFRNSCRILVENERNERNQLMCHVNFLIISDSRFWSNTVHNYSNRSTTRDCLVEYILSECSPHVRKVKDFTLNVNWKQNHSWIMVRLHTMWIKSSDAFPDWTSCFLRDFPGEISNWKSTIIMQLAKVRGGGEIAPRNSLMS